jgi:hypothetical protein
MLFGEVSVNRKEVYKKIDGVTSRSDYSAFLPLNSFIECPDSHGTIFMGRR